MTGTKRILNIITVISVCLCMTFSCAACGTGRKENKAGSEAVSGGQTADAQQSGSDNKKDSGSAAGNDKNSAAGDDKNSAAGDSKDSASDDSKKAGKDDKKGKSKAEAQDGNHRISSLSGSGLVPEEYVHYDPSDFYEKCDEMTAMAEAGKGSEAFSLYEELYDELMEEEDMYAYAQILFYEDISDEYYKEEQQYSYDVSVEMEDSFLTACSAVANSQVGESFGEFLNDGYVFDAYKEYEPLTEELRELISGESGLVADYNVLADEDGGRGSEKFYKEAGDIFVQLVDIRDKIAKEMGYDNYCDYCDTEVYGRDYSSSDLEKMKTAARNFGSDYIKLFYLSYYHLPEYDDDAERLISDLGICIDGISKYSDEAYSYLKENALYSIGDEKNRLDGAFTMQFSVGGTPLIFEKSSDWSADLLNLTHEFGHFTDAYVNIRQYPLLDAGSYDIFEIHSNGLSVLAADNYSKLFSEEDVKSMEAYTLLFMIMNFMDGCMYDEWQRGVYADPDMTIDEINELFLETSKEYGAASMYEDPDKMWMLVNHNFESPMYYVSYAVSAAASLQIWEKSLSDYDGAVKAWESVIESGAYDEGYMTVIEKAGLEPFTNTSYMEELLDKTYSAVFDLMGIDR